MEETLIVVVVSLLYSFLLAEIFYRLRFPRVIGQIVAGVLLGLPLFGWLFSETARHTVGFLAEIGTVFLMLFLGLEVSVRYLKSTRKEALLVAVFSAVIPFLLGYFLMAYLFHYFTPLIGVVVGACLALTAEGTTIKHLEELKAVTSRVGSIIIGAAIIDNVFEILLLSVVLVLHEHSVGSLLMLPVKVFIFIEVVLIFYFVLPKIISFIHKEHSRETTFSVVLIIGLLIATISKFLQVGTALGAFIAGMIIKNAEKDKNEEHDILATLKMFIFSLIVPFFFINVGLHIDFASIVHNFGLVLAITSIAFLGKIGGAILITPFTSLSLKQTHLIGWGMNSRGAVELVIAEFARLNNMIPIEVYSAIVFMALLTSLAFPIVLRLMVASDSHVLE
ncbi:hypothetical protein COY95_03520 [Candidatus Woesearchaeota archaeon CG_4_10_14_0_8_um_filter_47_5]|nr:MAG: hypothetical protein COY95_03520 [Candidatus Woesearchaeota archaeon CG_4_10_14_0_8_um_filter_47_5]